MNRILRLDFYLASKVLFLQGRVEAHEVRQRVAGSVDSGLWSLVLSIQHLSSDINQMHAHAHTHTHKTEKKQGNKLKEALRVNWPQLYMEKRCGQKQADAKCFCNTDDSV